MLERRKHKRFQMPRGTFVFMRNELDRLRNYAQMNIGEIAMVLYKSQPELMGQVRDLSIGGVAFDVPAYPLPTADHVELDLLMAEQGIYVHNIPYATISGNSADKGKAKKSACIRTNALHFKNLDTECKSRLRELLAHHVG